MLQTILKESDKQKSSIKLTMSMIAHWTS